VSIAAVSGMAAACADDGSSAVLHRSIIYSGNSTDEDLCNAEGSSELWDMNEIEPLADMWFANLDSGDLHVGLDDMGMPNPPPEPVLRKLGDPECDIDSDLIPDFNAYPGADQPQ
jgi:hypothetical protein